jgi:hypothetical protein
MSQSKRFKLETMSRLNPETLQEDLPYWAVFDNYRGMIISEHDTEAKAICLLNLINNAFDLELAAKKHKSHEFTSNDAEIESASSVIEEAECLVSACYPAPKSSDERVQVSFCDGTRYIIHSDGACYGYGANGDRIDELPQWLFTLSYGLKAGDHLKRAKRIAKGCKNEW